MTAAEEQQAGRVQIMDSPDAPVQVGWTEEQWQLNAVGLRDALRGVGVIVPECLPADDGACGASAAVHYATYLGLLRARVELMHDNLSSAMRMMAFDVYAEDFGNGLRAVDQT